MLFIRLVKSEVNSNEFEKGGRPADICQLNFMLLTILPIYALAIGEFTKMMLIAATIWFVLGFISGVAAITDTKNRK